MAQIPSYDELCKLSLIDLKSMGKGWGLPCANKTKSEIIAILDEHKKILESMIKKASTKSNTNKPVDAEKNVPPVSVEEAEEEPEAEDYLVLCEESVREAIHARAVKLVATGALDDMIKMMLRNWLSERIPQPIAPPETDIFTIFEETKAGTVHSPVVTPIIPPATTKTE